VKNVTLTGVERLLKDSEIICSCTDPHGLITFVNTTFTYVTGFERDEALGKPHNIIRHPDVPRALYYLLWETIRQGETFFGITINRCKNGDHYWTLGYFHPDIRDGEIIGYRSTRRGLRKEELKQQVAQLYKTVRKAELAKPRYEQIEAGLNCLQKELKKLGYSDYQDFAKLALL